MNAVAALAADSGARLVRKVGTCRVGVFKSYVDKSFFGIFLEPHQYELKVLWADDRRCSESSFLAENPSEVEFLLGVMYSEANTKNFSFQPDDQTKEFTQFLCTLK